MASKIKYSFFSILFIYIYIYMPDIKYVPIPTPLFLLPFTYHYFLSDKVAFSRFFKTFKNEIVILLFLWIYVLILDASTGHNVYFTHVSYYIFEVFPTSFFIVCVLLKKIDRNSFFKLIVFVGTTAAIISMVSLLVPQINYLLNSILKGATITDEYTGRNYGFSAGFLYAYPICQGFIGVIALTMLNKNKKYIVNFIFIFISIVINARTGLLPIILFLVYSFLKFKLKILFYVILFIIAFIIAYNCGVFSAYQELVDWNLTMFFDISNQFFGSDLGKYGNSYTWFEFIVDNFIVLPTNTLDWIFGEHREIFLDSLKNSDMGYINDLIYGGLILVSFISLFFIKVVLRLYKMHNSDGKLLSFLVLGIYLLANIKGEFFRPSPANRILILVYVYFVYNFIYVFKSNCNSYTSK